MITIDMSLQTAMLKRQLLSASALRLFACNEPPEGALVPRSGRERRG